MFTVNFIDFFFIFRKGNIAAGNPWPAVIFMASLLLGPLLAAPRPAFAAQSGDAEEPARIYHARDLEGNRIFGTDHRAAPSFYTDPQTGDRHFQTSPPSPAASGGGTGPEYIFVAPEVYPGNGWQSGQGGLPGVPPIGPPGGQPVVPPIGPPNDSPGVLPIGPPVGPPDGQYNYGKPPRPDLGPPPGGYPSAYDRPPTGGGSFIPRNPAWPGKPR